MENNIQCVVMDWLEKNKFELRFKSIKESYDLFLIDHNDVHIDYNDFVSLFFSVAAKHSCN